MIRRIPVLATVVVLIAIGVMVRLGVWQLDRLHEKEALLERYRAAQGMSAEIAWPSSGAEAERQLYRRASLDCAKVTDALAMAGHNIAGETGMGHVVTCNLPGGGEAKVVLGWSAEPTNPDWRGGRVTGVIAPGGESGPRLIASPPQAGLAANAMPDPADIPNNHLSYAVQWFLFAATALVIYAIALWKRLKA